MAVINSPWLMSPSLWLIVLALVLGACTPLSVREKPVGYRATPEQIMAAIEAKATQLEPSGLIGQDYTNYRLLNKTDHFISFDATAPLSRSNPKLGKVTTVQANAVQIIFTLAPFGEVTKVSASGYGNGVYSNIGEIYRYLDSLFPRAS